MVHRCEQVPGRDFWVEVREEAAAMSHVEHNKPENNSSAAPAEGSGVGAEGEHRAPERTTHGRLTFCHRYVI